MARRSFVIFSALAMLVICGFAKESSIVMFWPSSDKPTFKITFGKFRQLGNYAGQNSFVSDVTIENLLGKSVPRASFTVYLLDAAKVRVGSGTLNVNDLGPSQQARVAFQVMSVGIPASVYLVAHNDASGVPTSLKTVALKVISVPPGATLKVDGQDVGVTLELVNLSVGTHTLSFSKEGYATGSTPVEIAQDELPGGSITFELGGLSQDSVELRNGTTLLGDVMSMSMTDVVIRINGKDQSFNRNEVKKIILVERQIQQPASAASQ